MNIIKFPKFLLCLFTKFLCTEELLYFIYTVKQLFTSQTESLGWKQLHLVLRSPLVKYGASVTSHFHALRFTGRTIAVKLCLAASFSTMHGLPVSQLVGAETGRWTRSGALSGELQREVDRVGRKECIVLRRRWSQRSQPNTV